MPTPSLRTSQIFTPRILTAFAAVAIVLTGCIEVAPYPTPAELQASLGNKLETLASIEAMLIDEVPGGPATNGCVIIGPKRIGRYRENREGLWVLPARQLGIQRADALRIEQFTQDRFEAYVAALEEVGASLASYCFITSHTKLTVASSGLGISGCTTVVERSATGEMPGPGLDSSQGARDEVRDLAEGWRINQDCT